MLLMPMPRAHRTSSVAVADVFSVDLYTGTGATKTITTGVNLSANGGLVWTKTRSFGNSHALQDTVRGATKNLTIDTPAQVTYSTSLTSFTSTGYTLGADTVAEYHNQSGRTLVSWTFRKAAKFFDVVTYTGNGGESRAISHSLGSEPGMIIIKSTSSSSAWVVYHRSAGATYKSHLNTTEAKQDQNGNFGGLTPSSTTFGVGYTGTNENLGTFVAYLFGHDAAGVIQCDSYTGNGSATGPTVTLGWQPQFLMIKRTDSTGDWWIYDSARSTSNPRINKLLANSGAAEDTAGENVDFNATSFQLKSTDSVINESGATYSYMAIKAE